MQPDHLDPAPLWSAPPPPPPPPPTTTWRPNPSAPPLPPLPYVLDLECDKAHSIRIMQEEANDAGFQRPFQPCYMFFYGSLMDPEVLQAVLGLPSEPGMRPATLSGFHVKMWGIYPALVPAESGDVFGKVWHVDSKRHFLRLQAYETSAYKWVECQVTLEDGEILSSCRTFCWADDANSKELEDGSFDFERYQRYFKPSVTRDRPTVLGWRAYEVIQNGVITGCTYLQNELY